ncbi:hypothetical protein PAXINDRAFT_169007 [Paxillus involutus ATCC 200175]|uniref:Unplaced genomic scaffold PAXINscaffold_14, whole genome shotgun sequence n=1 Tax=Paxillus involutus ATCC 200175 TaxID=664439 RepID=A0A0C9SZG0_PAXIN|nr:hypothetical protein PAXINDRAFT_169007 [Paxillus involutus ATCC 200175]
MAAPPDKNFLSIRFTEPVVCLRSTERESRHGGDTDPPPAVVRGLLTLKLAKPTKISSIELELQGSASTKWTQGAGPSRLETTEQYKVHSASAVVFQAGLASQAPQRASSTARPTVQFRDDHNEPWRQRGTPGARLGRPPGQGHLSVPSGSYLRSASLDPRHLSSPHVRRHLSSDDLQIEPNSESQQLPQQRQNFSEPAPPYTPPSNRQSLLDIDSYPYSAGQSPHRSQSAASSSRFGGSQSSPVPFTRGLTPEVLYDSPTVSMHSGHDVALSRTSSIEELPEDEDGSSHLHPANVAYYGLSRVATGSSGRSPESEYRGRSRSRFSFRKVAHVFDAMRERVRSQSPRAGSEERGRTLIKGKDNARVGAHGVWDTLPHVGVTEVSEDDGVNDQRGDGWIVFPKGTYTYPIFFTIPNNSSPSMKADHGSMMWKVKAEVKRPSALKLKMTAQREVIVVCAPADNDSDEAEGIDVERQWDSQFQYRIQISKRSFPVGGKIPIQLSITPLAKIKVHRILVHLDERTEYYTQAKTHAMSDPIRRATLLTVKHQGSDERHSEPILPLASEHPGAFRKSPLYRFLGPDQDESEMASSFTGPGPWIIRHQLRVPDSCAILRPSNQTKGSNIMVDHSLKIILRVERQEEGAGQVAGRNKLYDITIHTPIRILSCRCTPDWTSLPRYDAALEGESVEDQSICPCSTRHLRASSHGSEAPPLLLHPVTSRHSTHSGASSRSGTFSTHFQRDGLPSDSAMSRNNLYERLVSGLESETGEAPPSYESFGALRSRECVSSA